MEKITTKKELEERFFKAITKYHLHLAGAHKKYTPDWGAITVFLTFTGRELGFNSDECEELFRYGIIKEYANTAGLDQIEIKLETRKLMCQKMNDKLRRLGFKELRCRI